MIGWFCFLCLGFCVGDDCGFYWPVWLRIWWGGSYHRAPQEITTKNYTWNVIINESSSTSSYMIIIVIIIMIYNDNNNRNNQHQEPSSTIMNHYHPKNITHSSLPGFVFHLQPSPKQLRPRLPNSPMLCEYSIHCTGAYCLSRSVRLGSYPHPGGQVANEGLFIGIPY